mgnify:FL=1
MSGITILGAGLAGCEAALQCARRGVPVTLIEQKPAARTPAHRYDGFAELCCSNSLRSGSHTNAVGLLKEELAAMGSIVMEAVAHTRVAAGGAVAVDRQRFSDYITDAVRSHPLITVVCAQAAEIPAEGRVIVATGPLTDGALSENVRAFFGGSGYLSFFDASAPLVDVESIDQTKTYLASRYDKGDADYINCPMEKDEYLAFWHALCEAEEAPVHDFEDKRVFEGCMPVETMARRGEDTLRFGPLKPVGLINPHTGALPYAVVQLRRDNTTGTVYNMVGFQTHLKFGEQKRVFGMIPGLENAEFLRYGVMHRNSYLDSPRLLDGFYRARKDPRVSFAGQFTGVEGYVESAVSGLYAGATAAIELLTGRLPEPLPRSTATGALAAYVSNPAVTEFQPMNVNFGIIDGSGVRAKGKQARLEAIADRALATVSASAFAAENVR